MKRKDIKNDKVLRAITIGLATMIAATSAPLNVYADEAEPATADGTGGEQDKNNSVEVTDENVNGGIDAANELFESATDSIEPVINNEGDAKGDGLLPVAINDAVAAGQVVDANDGIITAAEDLITAAGAVAETEQDLENVKTALETSKSLRLLL